MSGREKTSIAIVYLVQMALKGLGIIGIFGSSGYCDVYFEEDSHRGYWV
jgi:hypothetical protein